MVLSSHQPNFLPYMGLFYKMWQSDFFVFSDEHQFSTSGMHNYNYIKINDKAFKIRVPIRHIFGDSIKQVRITYELNWIEELRKTLSINYKKAPYYDEVMDFLFGIIDKRYDYLYELNIALTSGIADRMGMYLHYALGSNLKLSKKKDERIIEMCKVLGADTYYSGTGGKAYNDESKYEAAGIRLVYSDYDPKEYQQLGNRYVENLSVLDWIFNKGFRIPEEWRKAV